MDGRAVMFLLTLTLLSSVALTMAAALCDSCNCLPDGLVLCQCGPNSQSMDFTPQMIQGEQRRSSIVNVTVMGCRQVVLRKGSLSELMALEALKVVNVSTLKVEAKAMERVDSLVLEDVASLEMQPQALLRTSIKVLHMDRVSIGKLERVTLADIQGLQSLMLINVNVDKVESGAVKLAMGKKSEFIVQNTHFDTVMSDGVLVTSVGVVSVVRAAFDKVEKNGFNVTASDAVLVDQSAFGADLDSHGFCMTAAQVNLTGNFFSKLPDGILAKNTRHLRPGQRLLFKDNSVGQPLLDVPDIAVAQADDAVSYVGNSFLCECNDERLTENLEKLMVDGLATMLEDNFCYSKKCPKSVNHAMLLRYLQSDKGATCTDEQLCKLTPATTATTMRTTTTRVGSMVPGQTTSGNGTGHDKNGSSSSSTALVLPLLAAIITFLHTVF